MKIPKESILEKEAEWLFYKTINNDEFTYQEFVKSIIKLMKKYGGYFL